MLSFAALLVAAAFLSQTAGAPAQAPPKPLDCSAPVHTQFDFWIGEWDVVPNGRPLAAGQKPMTNIVTKEYGGCVVIERWDGAQLTGSSFNIYDRTRGQWSQTWVDSSGGLHQYWGSLNKEGAMVFQGDVPLPRAAQFAGRRIIRLTFFPLGPDKLRQLSEAYMADGSWTVNYDLIYTRRLRAARHGGRGHSNE